MTSLCMCVAVLRDVVWAQRGDAQTGKLLLLLLLLELVLSLKLFFMISCLSVSKCVFRPGTDLISLLILWFLLAATLFKKSLKLRRFKADQDEIWQGVL